MVVVRAQTFPSKPKVGAVLYAVDIKDNSKVYSLTVISEKKQAENWSDESFLAEKKLIKGTAAVPKKKKKKFGQFLKEVVGGAEEDKKTTTEVLTNQEGTFNYKMTENNTALTDDDDMMEGHYKFENDGGGFRHGFFYEIGGGFYKEVLFVDKDPRGKYYREYPETLQNIFVVGNDKVATIEKAATMNFEAEKKKYYTPDPKSGRLPHAAVDATDYTFNLNINPLTGEFELPHTIDFMYLPTKTIEGRNIMYNRALITIGLYKGEQLIGEKTVSKGHKRGKWVEKVINSMDVPYRSFNKLKEGKYQLRFSILGNEPFFLADFEIYTVPNPDINAENTEFYIMKGCNNGYVMMNPGRTIEDIVRYSFAESPFFKLKPEKKDEVKGVKITLLKDGKFFGRMSSYDDSETQTLTIDVMNGNGKPILDTEIDLEFENPKSKDYYTREQMPDGSYTIEIHVQDQLFATASFKMADNEIVLEGNSNRKTADLKRFLVSKDGYVYIPLKYHE